MPTTYIKIATVTVGSGGTSAITFSNIPQTYTDLILQISARDSRNLYVDDFGIQINGSTSNFSYKALYGTGNSTGVAQGSYSVTGVFNAATATASTFGNATIYIPNYTVSAAKGIIGDSVNETNATNAQQWLTATLWNNTAAITSISIVGNDTPTTIQQYSTATLYGIKNS